MKIQLAPLLLVAFSLAPSAQAGSLSTAAKFAIFSGIVSKDLVNHNGRDYKACLNNIHKILKDAGALRRKKAMKQIENLQKDLVEQRKDFEFLPDSVNPYLQIEGALAKLHTVASEPRGPEYNSKLTAEVIKVRDVLTTTLAEVNE